MGEYLPDGSYQPSYPAKCESCGADMPVNLYGQGTCPKCCKDRNPMIVHQSTYI